MARAVFDGLLKTLRISIHFHIPLHSESSCHSIFENNKLNIRPIFFQAFAYKRSKVQVQSNTNINLSTRDRMD